MLPAVVECASWQDVVDVVLYDEVEHGIVTRCVDESNAVVVEIDLMQTAIVGYADRMKVRVRPHPWAWNIAKAIHGHASVEEELFEGDKPVKVAVEQRGWSCSYKVAIDWD